MQISTDILSLMMTTRADSGIDVRQRVGPSSNSGSRFEKILSEAIAETEAPTTDNKRPETGNAEKADTADQARPQKPDDDPDEDIAAGMMAGNQEKVVIILEGDMESAAIPEISVGAVQTENNAYQVDIGTDTVIDTVDADDPVDAEADAVAVKTEPEKQTVTYAEVMENQAEISEAPKTADQTKNTGTASVTADTEQEIDGTQGEVTARTPITRTSERQENESNNSDFSEDGDLSHLENENDAAPVKGQKEKTYTQTADDVRNRAEAVHEPVNNAPPLANGIKPEQFVADQEVKQAAPTDAPVRQENLFDEMVSRIETMQTESTQTMSIQLKPEFLGKVALDIAIDAAGLHVKINAENSDVRSMINGQINTLIESLENKGIEVVEVEVTYTGVNNGAFRDPREGGQAQPDRPRRSYREIDPADGAAYYAALPIEMLDYYLDDASVSSVEYRA